jgi:hypothetical protein
VTLIDFLRQSREIVDILFTAFLCSVTCNIKGTLQQAILLIGCSLNWSAKCSTAHLHDLFEKISIIACNDVIDLPHCRYTHPCTQTSRLPRNALQEALLTF